jgi:hypothetical protein
MRLRGGGIEIWRLAKFDSKITDCQKQLPVKRVSLGRGRKARRLKGDEMTERAIYSQALRSRSLDGQPHVSATVGERQLSTE